MLTFSHSSVTYGVPASTELLVECRRKQTLIRTHEGEQHRTQLEKHCEEVHGGMRLCDRMYLERLLRGSDHYLSNEGRLGVGQELGQGMGTKNIPSPGNHMCKDCERRPCDQSICI